ncbi:MAG: hypothetical protein JWM47_765 [Acidimicrobiales bacterium]|nr:hypothetical protein [Acidimicrobiales bacterium]
MTLASELEEATRRCSVLPTMDDREIGSGGFLRGLSFIRNPARWMLKGGVGLGLVGAVVGLVLGLDAYPPTAWFAVHEIGIPSGFLGSLLGFAAGSVAWCVEQFRKDPDRP